MKPVQSLSGVFNDENSALCPDNSSTSYELWSPRRFKSMVVRKLQTQRYRRELKHFHTEGLTYQRQSLLWHLAISCSIKARSLLSRYRCLVTVANELMMNSLEITHWSMQLTELSSSDRCLKMRRLLIFTGFASKLYFNSDVRHLELRCCKLLPSFSNKFRQWLLMSECDYDLPASKLNLFFSELSAGQITSKPAPLRALKDAKRPKEVDQSTEEDWGTQMALDMITFEAETMKGEKLSPIDM